MDPRLMREEAALNTKLEVQQATAGKLYASAQQTFTRSHPASLMLSLISDDGVGVRLGVTSAVAVLKTDLELADTCARLGSVSRLLGGNARQARAESLLVQAVYMRMAALSSIDSRDRYQLVSRAAELLSSLSVQQLGVGKYNNALRFNELAMLLYAEVPLAADEHKLRFDRESKEWVRDDVEFVITSNTPVTTMRRVNSGTGGWTDTSSDASEASSQPLTSPSPLSSCNSVENGNSESGRVGIMSRALNRMLGRRRPSRANKSLAKSEDATCNKLRHVSVERPAMTAGQRRKTVRKRMIWRQRRKDLATVGTSVQMQQSNPQDKVRALPPATSVAAAASAKRRSGVRSPLPPPHSQPQRPTTSTEQPSGARRAKLPAPPPPEPPPPPINVHLSMESSHKSIASEPTTSPIRYFSKSRRKLGGSVVSKRHVPTPTAAVVSSTHDNPMDCSVCKGKPGERLSARMRKRDAQLTEPVLSRNEPIPEEGF